MRYYYDHKAEIDAKIAAELEQVDRVHQAKERSPAWLKLKVRIAI
jgi:hypothetical protein